jgi:hypothetical protein
LDGHYDTLDAAKVGTAVITYSNLLQRLLILLLLHCLFFDLRAAENEERDYCGWLQHL